MIIMMIVIILNQQNKENNNPHSPGLLSHQQVVVSHSNNYQKKTITLNSPCWNQQERQLEVQASSASPSHGKQEIGGLPHQPFSLHTQLVLLNVLFLVIVILLLLQSPEFSFLSWLALLMCSRTLKLPEQRNAHLEVFLCCFVSINKLDETNKHTSTR